MRAPAVGTFERTQTIIEAIGQVMVNGITYPAEIAIKDVDSDPRPIEANRQIVVAGWRIDPTLGVVLLVRDPLPKTVYQPGPSIVHSNSNAESASYLQLTSFFVGHPFSWLLLILGQVICIICVLVGPIVMMVRYSEILKLNQDDQSLKMNLIFNGAILIVSSFMFFVVFKRAIALKQIAEAQGSENRRLWLAISELREKAKAQSGVAINNDASASPPGAA